MATIGKTILNARDRLGLTQQELADRLGVTRQAVGNWEKDHNLPKGARAAKVAAVLQIAPSVIDPFSFSSVLPVDASLETFTIPNIPLERLGQIGKADSDMMDVMRSLSVAIVNVQKDLKHCFCVTISDASMAPLYHEGDEAIVDPTLAPRDGDDVIVNLAERTTLLRTFRARGKDSSGHEVFDLCTPNPDHVTVTANSDQPAAVLGVVVEKRLKRRANR